MANVSRRFVGTLVLLMLSFGLLLGSLIAQDASPVDADAAAAAEAKRREELLKTSPLPLQPETAPDLFEAAVLMVDLARPHLARLYMDQLMELKPDAQMLLDLRLKYGPAEFMKMANIKELQPVSSDLLEEVNRLMAARASDPVRIQKLVADLGGSNEERLLAEQELKNGGQAIVVPLLNLLQHNPSPEQERNILHILMLLGHRAEAPLVAALDMPDDDVRAGLISVLGHVGNRATLSHLWYFANSPKVPAGVKAAARDAIARIVKMDAGRLANSPVESVVTELNRLARLHYQHKYDWLVDDDGNVSMWVWKREAESVVLVKIPPRVASNIVGSKFARQALSLSPERRDIQVLFLSMILAADGMLAGWDKPLPTGPGTAHDLSLVAGEDVVADVLREALKGGQIANAVAALRVLGQIGTLRMVRSADAQRSPVLAALNYPDTRVQFAAAGTVMQLDPQTKFPGVGRVIGILSRALTGQGKPVALVVDPNPDRASQLAGFLNELGYAPQMRTTGRDGFRFASENADVEIVFIHPATVKWPLSETLTNFRADSRTASIPIVLYGPEDFAGRMRRYVDDNPLVAYFGATGTTEGLQAQLTPFLKNLTAPPLNEEQRAIQAEVASYWLAHISEGQRTKIYDLQAAVPSLLAAAHNVPLTENCLLALGAIASRDAQEKMAELLLDEGVETRLRATAAIQLAFHIQRHGLVVSNEQIAQIHEMWETPGDPALHTAVGAVIGSLRPNSRLVGERLQEFQEQPALELIQP